MQFKDRANYRNYAEDSIGIFVLHLSDGPLALLANEPIWLLINIILAQFANPEAVMRMIIFAGAARFSYVLTRADPKNSVLLMLFLLMPQLLKNYITHLRQGLAMAIFFSGYFTAGPARRWILMFIAPFVHASFFFIVPFVILPVLLRKMRLAVDIRLFIMASYALLVTLTLGILATIVGARQAGNYDFAMTDVSGLGFIYWLAVLIFFLAQGKWFLESRQEASSTLLFYVLSYFFIEVTARIFESAMPFVLLAGLALPGWKRWVFTGAFLLYSMVQWLIRLSSPMPF